MTCKGCKAVKGDRHPCDIVDFTGCRCGLGFKTNILGGVMMPVLKCKKIKSWKELERAKKYREDQLNEMD